MAFLTSVYFEKVRVSSHEVTSCVLFWIQSPPVKKMNRDFLVAGEMQMVNRLLRVVFRGS